MKIHMVKSGDTMYNIAQKHGVQLEQLIAFNPQISNPDQIDAGMKVKIPSAVIQGNPHVEYAQKHVVKQGDSLWKISKAWGLPLKALVDANPQLKNPSVLLTGEIVNIPIQASVTDNTNMAGVMNAMHPAFSPNMPYVSNIQNTISPGNAPQPMPLPTPIEAVTKPVETVPKQVESITKPVETVPKQVESITKPVESITKPFPISQKEEQQFPQFISPSATQPYFGNEPNKNMMEPYPSPYPSETLFAQFNVPAVEAQGKPDLLPSNQLPTYSTEQPMMTSPYMASKPEQLPSYLSPTSYMPSKEQLPSYLSPTYSAEQPMMTSPYMTSPYTSSYPPSLKPDCGCGCGGSANTMPYYQSQPPYPYSNANTMPYSQSQPPYPSISNYYAPQPQLQNMQWNPADVNQMVPPMGMTYPSVVSPASYYPYMSPCYPVSPYADMSYLHAMQSPYSSWPNSNENIPPASTLAESAQDQGPSKLKINEFTELSKEAPIKKTMKVPRNSNKQPSQKLDDRTLLHNFIQNKTNHGSSSRNGKFNEPWINR